MSGDSRRHTTPDDRLDSWKEIASFLRRSVSTAQRWERAEGLPVRRLPHAKTGSVFAHSAELHAWIEARSGGAPGPGPAVRSPAVTSCRLVWGESEFALGEGPTVLGRSESANICLKQSRVSRHHARITVSRAVAILEDLGSKNGTFVGGRRLAGRRRLEDNDVIEVGSVRLVFSASPDGASTETGSNF